MSAALATSADVGTSPAGVPLRRTGSRITLRAAPHREPPFDDELDAPVVTGVLDQPLPLELRRGPRPVRPAPREPSALRAAVPDPADWGRRLLIGIIETSAGKRPLHQLASLLSRGVGQGLSADFERAARTGRPHWTHSATVRSVRASEPADGVAELCATVATGARVRAIAMRLEIRHGRWCCTRLLLG